MSITANAAPEAGAPTQPVDLRRAWTVVLLLTLAYILSFIDRQILALLIEPIQSDLHITDTQFGLLSGLAFSIFYATMGIPIAGLADRSSRPRLIVAGIAFWSLATMACGLGRSFTQLFLARICVGAGEAALSPATYSLISDLFPRRSLGRAAAVYSSGSLLGAGIAFLVGGLVISAVSHGNMSVGGLHLAPWQMTFLIVGAPGLILAAVIAVFVREPGHRRNDGDVPGLDQVFALLAANRAIYLPLMLGFSLAAMALFSLLGWMPAVLIRNFGLKPQDVGLSLGAIAIVAGVGGNLASGWLVDIFTARGRSDAPFRVGMIGAAGVVAPAVALGFAGSAHSALAIFAIALFFASFPIATSTAAIQIAAPTRMRSRVSAIFLLCNSFIGLALGSVLVGFVNDFFFRGHAIGTAMATITALSGLLALIVLNGGRRPFAASHPLI